MKSILSLFLFLPFASNSQSMKVNVFDKFIRQHRIELDPLPLIKNGKDRASVAFSSLGSNLYLELSGTGWGTSTIDEGNEIIFLFSNDSTVTIESSGLQGFETYGLQNRYRHRYRISEAGVEALSRFDLVGIRKYSFVNYSDIDVFDEGAAGMKKLSTLFRNELKKAQVLKEFKHINQNEIRNFVGDSVAFCSKVAAVHFSRLANAVTQFKLQPDSSTQWVNVVIRGQDRKNFPDVPATLYDKKNVCVYGVVKLKDGWPQLTLWDKNQIRITSPISSREAAHFVGDSVMVVDRVLSGKFFSGTNNQLTLLNMGAAYPDQSLTVVIEQKNRDQFDEAPEAFYQNKKVKVSGKVTLFKNKPQIVVSRKSQIMVLEEEPMVESPVTALPVKEPASLVTEAVSIDVQPPVRREKVNIPPTYTETFSEFPGGTTKLLSYFSRNLRCPENAGTKKDRTVTATFVVDMDGALRNIEIVESGGKAYDTELVRLLQQMPKWKPRVRNGYAVLDKLYQTVTFRCSAEK